MINRLVSSYSDFSTRIDGLSALQEQMLNCRDFCKIPVPPQNAIMRPEKINLNSRVKDPTPLSNSPFSHFILPKRVRAK
jgi:hypothetical protein